MEWRCEWCGKPHAEDDPPCDECGHHKFEKAVVQVAGDVSDAGAPVWVCTECGREHQKNSPPCSRCGNPDLERRQPDYSDLPELGGTSYLDVLEPKYAVGYAIAGVLGTILLLAVLGVISLPTIGGPSIPDAPGNATTYQGASVVEIEDEYVRLLNADRENESLRRLERRGDLDRLAAYYNKGRVAAEYGNGENVTYRDAVEAVSPGCDRAIRFLPYATPPVSLEAGGGGDPNETAIAESMQIVSTVGGDDATSSDATALGVDVHVTPDEWLYVTLVFC